MKKEKQMTWIEAIVKVLETAKTPMHYTQIWDVIRDKHYRECEVDSNPEIMVNVNIQQNKDKIVRFGGKGYYILRKALDTNIKKYLEQNTFSQQCIIGAYGKMWSRAKFEKNKYVMIGKLANAKKSPQVDLSTERGIYVLYNGYDIVYVGQTTNPIATRLKTHAKRNIKWDSFSWYGIDSVMDNGQICKEKVLITTSNALIDALEAVLIIAAEPGLNKQRGKNIRGQEYQQI